MVDDDDHELADVLVKTQQRVEEATWDDYTRSFWLMTGVFLVAVAAFGVYVAVGLLGYGWWAAIPGAVMVAGSIWSGALTSRVERDRDRWMTAVEWGDPDLAEQLSKIRRSPWRRKAADS